MSGIQHLVKGGRESNRVGEARVDKIETDQFNSIVERITHGRLNPSKLAAEVTKAKVMEESPEPVSVPQAAKLPGQIATWGAGPAHQLAAQRPDAHVNFLAEKVAMLEHKLAKYETFNGQDNDVVQTTSTPAKKIFRGADSSAMGNVIRKKNAKTKDPVDGKPDGSPTPKQPEAQMAGERVNILGISMNEWREMTGLKAPPVDLTARPPIAESYEDEDEGSESGVVLQDDVAAEHQLWSVFLEAHGVTPDEFSAFVDEADEAGDEDALVAVSELEDEFVEALSYYLEGDAATKQSVSDYLSKGGKVTKLPTRKAKGYMPAGMKVKGGPATQFGHQLPKKTEDVDTLWSEWLEERGLSVETFDALVETIETEEDLVALEELQAMFEADLAEMKVGDTVAVNSVLDAKTKIKPADNSIKTAHPLIRQMAAAREIAKLNKKPPADEDDEAFECDDDGNGHPDMNGKDWAAAMKRMKKKHKKTGGQS